MSQLIARKLGGSQWACVAPCSYSSDSVSLGICWCISERCVGSAGLRLWSVNGIIWIWCAFAWTLNLALDAASCKIKFSLFWRLRQYLFCCVHVLAVLFSSRSRRFIIWHLDPAFVDTQRQSSLSVWQANKYPPQLPL
jgi:hypothetical protein